MDFIKGLPLSYGYDMILVIICCLLKMGLFIPTMQDIDAEDLLDIKANLSTAYHPETDSQTKRVNQILEQYLRIFVNYQQDNWEHLLPLAEFAYNNTQHSATTVTPFFTNKGFHPRLEVSLDSVPSKSAHEMALDLKELHQYLRKQLQHTIKQYKRHSEDRRLPIPNFQVGNLVWLNSHNIRTN